MKNYSLQTTTKLAIVTGLYVALTYAFGFMSYGQIQFRLAEMLMLLCFFNKKYAISLVIGCAIANILSPYGIMDVLFGTLATGIACLGLIMIKNIWVASLSVTFANIIVGIEISLINDLDLIPSLGVIGWIMVGEFVVVTLIGVPLFKLLFKNENFKKMTIDI